MCVRRLSTGQGTWTREKREIWHVIIEQLATLFCHPFSLLDGNKLAKHNIYSGFRATFSKLKLKHLNYFLDTKIKFLT